MIPKMIIFRLMTLYMMQIINMQWSIYVVYVKPLADSLQTVDITDFLTMIVWHGRFLLSEFFGDSDRRAGSGNGAGAAGPEIQKPPDGARPFGGK